MTHLTDRQIGEYLDGELSDVESARIERHLDDCPICREEVDRVRDASERLSRDLEAAGVPGELEDADVWPGRAPAGTGEGGRLSLASRLLRRPVRSAAAVLLLLTVAGGAVAAVPGSPLRPLAVSLIDRARDLVGADGGEEPGFGLQVRPLEERLEVRILRPAAGTTLHVRVVRDSVGGVWASGARLRSAPGRIELMEPGPGTVRVHLPRPVRDARVLSDGEPVAVWSDGELRLRAPLRGSRESGYRIDLGPPEP